MRLGVKIWLVFWGGMAAHDLAVADKAEFVPPGDEFQEIVRPGVGDAGAVGDDQDLPEAHAPHQIVGGQGFAEAWLGVPQEFLSALSEVRRRRFHGPRLLLPQRIVLVEPLSDRPALGELLEQRPGARPVHPEPLGARSALHPLFPRQPAVEGPVREGLSAAVLVNGVVAPEDLIGNVGGLMLLPDALLHALLFRVADFRPARMGKIVGMGVGVDHRDDGLKGADVGGTHQLISFSCISVPAYCIPSRNTFL